MKIYAMTTRLTRLFTLFLCAFLLASCLGGSENAFEKPSTSSTDPGTGGGGTTTTTVASLVLSASGTQLNSDGSTTVSLTAVALDNNNSALTGKTVTFSADTGVVVITNATTDESGAATATLSTAGNPVNRVITVTASSGTATDEVLVNVTGTTTAISGSSAMVLNDTGTFTVTVKNSAGTGISAQAVTVTSSLNNTITLASPTTNSNGQLTFTLRAVNPGTDTVTVSSAGANATLAVAISGTSFGFTAPAANAEININNGTTLTPIVVRYTTDGNTPAVGKTVTFATTRGIFTGGGNVANVLTNSSGEASIGISSTSAGIATIQASVAADLVSTERSIEFVAITPATVTLQASPATIGVNESSTLTAVVRDATANPVKNKTVSFSLTQDATGGSISPVTATTNSQGIATAVYTAGALDSATNGVSISARESTTNEVGNTTLTVGKKSLFIRFGTGNKILEFSDTLYQQEWSVLVTDAGGNPVPGVTVTAKVKPKFYTKGRYAWNEESSVWLPLSSALNCDNEDRNYDGQLDMVGEDTNGNGQLDSGEDKNKDGLLDGPEDINKDGALTPGNVATITGSSTTSTEGFTTLKLTYPKEYTFWTTVILEVKGLVSGTESTATRSVTLMGLAKDFITENADPPGKYSPFGTGTLCSNTL